MSLVESGKGVQIDHLQTKYLSFGEKIVKIGPMNPEVIGL